MRVISFIEDEEVIKKILKHLGLWDRKARPPPKATGPPKIPEYSIDYSDSQIPVSDKSLYAEGHDFSVVDRSISPRPRLYEPEAGSLSCLICENLIRAERIGLPKSPQFCPVLLETAPKLPSPYTLLHLTSFPSSPHKIHTQHRVVAFCLTYKSKLSYTHTSKGSSSTQQNSCLEGID